MRDAQRHDSGALTVKQLFMKITLALDEIDDDESWPSICALLEDPRLSSREAELNSLLRSRLSRHRGRLRGAPVAWVDAALKGSPPAWFIWSQQVSLERDELSPAALKTLLHSLHPRQLLSLSVCTRGGGDELAEALASSPRLRALTTLTFKVEDLSPMGAATLRRRFEGGLKRLTIEPAHDQIHEDDMVSVVSPLLDPPSDSFEPAPTPPPAAIKSVPSLTINVPPPPPVVPADQSPPLPPTSTVSALGVTANVPCKSAPTPPSFDELDPPSDEGVAPVSEEASTPSPAGAVEVVMPGGVSTIAARLRARGIDLSSTPGEVLIDLSPRTLRAFEDAECDLADVIRALERGSLRKLASFGAWAHDEVSEHLDVLATRGITYYRFGEAGAPEDIPAVVEAFITSLQALDRILARRRYRDGITPEELGGLIGKAQDVVQRRLKELVESASRRYEATLRHLLSGLFAELDANHGLLELERAQSLAPGSPARWELMLALEILGARARVHDDVLLHVYDDEVYPALREKLRALFRGEDAPTTLAEARDAMQMQLSVTLRTGALAVLIDELIGHQREDGLSWRDVANQHESMELEAAPEEPPPNTHDAEVTSASRAPVEVSVEVPVRSREREGQEELAIVGGAPAEVSVSVEGGPELGARLSPQVNAVEQPPRGRARGAQPLERVFLGSEEPVDPSACDVALVEQSPPDKDVTSARDLTADSYAEEEDAHDEERSEQVPPAPPMVSSRNELETLRGEGVLHERITRALSAQTSPASMLMLLDTLERSLNVDRGAIEVALSSRKDLIKLDEDEYILRASIGLSEPFIDELVRASMESLLEDEPVTVNELLERLEPSPGGAFLSRRERGEDILRGLLCAAEEVSYCDTLSALMRTTQGDEPLLVLMRTFAKTRDKFYSRNFQRHLLNVLGIDIGAQATMNFLEQCVEAEVLVRAGVLSYRLASSALGAPSGARDESPGAHARTLEGERRGERSATPPAIRSPAAAQQEQTRALLRRRLLREVAQIKRVPASAIAWSELCGVIDQLLTFATLDEFEEKLELDRFDDALRVTPPFWSKALEEGRVSWLPVVRQLELVHVNVPLDAIQRIIGSRRPPQLEALRLDQCSFEPGAFELMLEVFRDVPTLSLKGGSLEREALSAAMWGVVSDHDHVHIAALPVNAVALRRWCPPELLSLSLVSCGLDEYGLEVLSAPMRKVRGFEVIETLHIEGDRVGAEAYSIFRNSDAFAGVERLVLRDAGVTAASLRGQGWRGLRALDLSHNPFGGEGARALAKNTAYSLLEELSISSTGLTAIGVKGLLHEAIFDSLRRLDLSNNPIGDAGARALAECPLLVDLEHLDVRGCLLTRAGVDALESSYYLRHTDIITR